MMKNQKLWILSVIALAFASCSKTEDAMVPGTGGTSERTTGTSNNSGVIGKVPPAFTQKVLLENFTSATAPDGPENDLLIRNTITNWPNRVVPACFHLQDAMDGTPTYEMLNLVNAGNSPMMPGVMQNRLTYGGKVINDDMTWNSNIANTLSSTPNVGLAIATSVNGNVITASVHVGFNSNTAGNWKLVAYVTRNSITGTGSGYDQANGSNTNPGSAFFNRGDPITGYAHNFVVTQLLTAVTGTTIPGAYMTTGGHYVQNFVFDVRTSTQVSDLNVVAFVVDDTDNIVVNAQQVIVGAVQDWD